jgi:hypothetical protein
MKTFLSVFAAIFITTTATAQVPVLSNYPTAQATIYLDFDGQYVAGTSWNWSGPINAQPAILTSSQITEIFNRVAEDYGIFNVNITTDSTVFLAAPESSRIRIIVTSSSQWYGLAGGVAYIGSFTWGDDTPAWVFSSLLNNDVKRVSEAISHEAGHTLGLHHQSIFDANCNKITEYYAGRGSGEIGWAPIMGVGYYRNLTTWYNGTNAMGCTSFQSDIDIITSGANNFGFRNDDHQDIHTAASPVTMGMAFSASGIINNASDRDVFTFDLSRTNNFRLSAVPQNVGSGNAGANVDIRVALLNQSADTIGRYNPAELLNVGIDTNLVSGRYYLVVDGVANTNSSEYGSVGFYNLSAYVLTVLPIHRLSLTARNTAGEHHLHWNYNSDDPVKEIHLESSKDGIHYNYLTKLSADTRSFFWKPADNSEIHYRIKVIVAADERAYYSNIVAIPQMNTDKIVQVTNRFVTNDILINVAKTFSFQLYDETGRLLQRGLLNQGSNRISTSRINKGVLLLHLQHNNERYTEKLIKR